MPRRACNNFTHAHPTNTKCTRWCVQVQVAVVQNAPLNDQGTGPAPVGKSSFQRLPSYLRGANQLPGANAGAQGTSSLLQVKPTRCTISSSTMACSSSDPSRASGVC